MPSRIIREGILTSDRVNALSESAELFYRRLMSVVDDFGRFSAKVDLLRSYCYPLRTRKMDDDLLTRHLAECIDAGLIIVYEVGSKSFLQLLDFKQQVRAKDSKYPAPPDELQSSRASHAQQMKTDVHLGVVVVGDVSEGGDGGEERKPRSRKTGLPADFAVSPAVRVWAEERGFARLDERLEDFIGKAKAKGYTYVDWDQAFMNAIRNDWAGINGRASAGTSTKQPTIHEKRAATAAALGTQRDSKGAVIDVTPERIG